MVCHDDLITPRHLPALAGDKRPPVAVRGTGRTHDPDRRDELIRVLKETGGNRQEAARLLGMSRVTLWKLLKKYDIALRTSVE